MNRQGRATPVDSSWYGPFNSFAIAPEGGRLAVGTGSAGDGLSVSLKQLSGGVFSRLSFGGQDRRPVWSPDGKTVAFVRDSTNGGGVYGVAADGGGAARLLAQLKVPVQEVAWSGDGRWLVLRTDNGTAGAGDLIGVRVDGDTAQVPLVTSRFTEMHPAVSPDGRWLAYISNETGANEVYVRPFPNSSAGRWQVSNGGGMSPVWSRDTRELFFVGSGGRLMSADVRTDNGFEVTGARTLFDVSGYALDL